MGGRSAEIRELEPGRIDGAKAAVGITTRAGTGGCFRVDLPLFAGHLNERLLQIGIWLVELRIRHQARVLMEPERKRLRISFSKQADAKAFGERFAMRLN